ncbi:MAG: glycosyltransferase [Candidatus Magasanikbacteria bacterium]
MSCQKKKLLFLVTQGAWGGAQKYVLDLAKNLVNTYEIFVAIGEKGNNPDLQEKLRKEAKGVHVIELKHLKRTICPRKDILALFEIKRLYEQIQPDIIHLNSSKAGVLGSYAKALLSKSQNPKILYTVHGWVMNEPMSSLKKKIYTFLEKNSAQQKDALIVLSEKEKDDGIHIHIPANKIHTLPLGIEPISFLSKTEARKQLLPDTQNDIWLGTIANFFLTKGLDILLNTIAWNKKALQNTNFLILGDGPERKNLEKMIQENNLTNVFLLGTKENASQYLKAFDCFLLPSKKEGFPYVLLEAMQAGLPIITNDVGGIKEMLQDYSSSHIIPANSSEKLAEALIHFSPRDYNKKTAAHQYTLENMIKKTRSLYESV